MSYCSITLITTQLYHVRPILDRTPNSRQSIPKSDASLQVPIVQGAKLSVPQALLPFLAHVFLFDCWTLARAILLSPVAVSDPL